MKSALMIVKLEIEKSMEDIRQGKTTAKQEIGHIKLTVDKLLREYK